MFHHLLIYSEVAVIFGLAALQIFLAFEYTVEIGTNDTSISVFHCTGSVRHLSHLLNLADPSLMPSPLSLSFHL